MKCCALKLFCFFKEKCNSVLVNHISKYWSCFYRKLLFLYLLKSKSPEHTSVSWLWFAGKELRHYKYTFIRLSWAFFLFFQWLRISFCFWQNPWYNQLKASLWFIHWMLELSCIWLVCHVSIMQIWKQPLHANWCRHSKKKKKWKQINIWGEKSPPPQSGLYREGSHFFPPHKEFFFSTLQWAQALQCLSLSLQSGT